MLEGPNDCAVGGRTKESLHPYPLKCQPEAPAAEPDIDHETLLLEIRFIRVGKTYYPSNAQLVMGAGLLPRRAGLNKKS